MRGGVRRLSPGFDRRAHSKRTFVRSDRVGLRLETLIGLRWLAVIGQATAVLVVEVWLNFSLPTLLCFALIGMSAWVNVVLRWLYPQARRLESVGATLVLAYDILQLSGLLYLTGGLQNPFSFLLLGPVIVSATTLPLQNTLSLGGLVLVAATVLAIFHWPLPWHDGQELHIPLLYVGGIWIALLCCLFFMAAYAFRVAEEARDLAAALTSTELVLQRELHLSALDGLAAAAAHELGTPLATIALVAKELEKEMEPDGPFADDIRLLRSQSQRCRDILGKLNSLSASHEGPMRTMPLSHIVEDVVDPHRAFGIDITITRDSTGPEPVAIRNPAILYGLGNIVENAVDFASNTVAIEMYWDTRQIRVSVCDDGPGFSSDVIDRIGEPYVTTRRRGESTQDSQEGLGLGFFIAKTLLERSGARLEIENLKPPASGAVVSIIWPRSAFEDDGSLSTARTLPLAAGTDAVLEA